MNPLGFLVVQTSKLFGFGTYESELHIVENKNDDWDERKIIH